MRTGQPSSPVPPTAVAALEASPRSSGNGRDQILSLVLHHDEETGLCAIELAAEADVVSKAYMLNMLRRLTEADALARSTLPTVGPCSKAQNQCSGHISDRRAAETF